MLDICARCSCFVRAIGLLENSAAESNETVFDGRHPSVGARKDCQQTREREG